MVARHVAHCWRGMTQKLRENDNGDVVDESWQGCTAGRDGDGGGQREGAIAVQGRVGLCPAGRHARHTWEETGLGLSEQTAELPD